MHKLKIFIFRYTYCIMSFLLFFIFFHAQSMIIKDIQQPVAAVWISDFKCAIGGKNGCMIIQCDDQKGIPSQEITKERVRTIAIDNNKKLLGLALSIEDEMNEINNRHKHALYDIITGKLEVSNNLTSTIPSLAFSSITDSFFVCSSDELISYKNNITQGKKYFLTQNRKKHPIKHHPTKNKLLYLSTSNELMVYEVNHDCLDLTIKISLDTDIKTVDYSPNGEYMLFQTADNSYFICNLANYQKSSDGNKKIQAHKLIHDDKNYVASAFHPKECIVVLLSDRSCIHYFNYVTNQYIASTQCLSGNFISWFSTSNRLTI